jgi:alpha-L-fucosidase
MKGKLKNTSITLAMMLLLLFQGIVQAQDNYKTETPEQKTKRMAWWTDARFGMFIHWGLYALPAKHE